MKRCPKDHFYDERYFDHCPECEAEEDSKTVALDSNKMRVDSNMHYGKSGMNSGLGCSSPEMYSGNSYGTDYSSEYTNGEGYLDHYMENEGERTVGWYKKLKGFDPVVGWLVCVEGASKGKDFRIKSERNFIGRSPEMDICIDGDNTISSRKHAILSYNPKESVFRILPGEGRGIVYLNNNEVFVAEKLKRGDIIQVGQTSLIFIPLCGDEFSW